MSRYLDTSTKAQMAKIMIQHGTPSRSSRKESVRSPRTIVGKTIWESSIGTQLGKVLNWECFFVNRARGLFLSVNVDDSKLASKTENIEWSGRTNIILDHVYLGCTLSNEVVAKYRDTLECRISAGGHEKLPTRASGEPDAHTISSLSYDMESYAKKCVERNCELANKTTEQWNKVATPCMDDHQFKENESVGELSTVCSQSVLKCLCLARVERPDILWSVNKLARSITKWTKAWDKRLSRLISYIHHTSEYRQYVMWETQHKKADWDCFKTPIVQEVLKIRNPLLEEHRAFLEVIRLFQSVGCLRNNLQFRTVQQKLNSYLSMQVYA